MTVSDNQTPFDDIAVRQPEKNGGQQTARRLAFTARPIREIVAPAQPQPMTGEDEDEDDDSIPLEIEEFRRELTWRLQKLIDAEQNGAG